MEKDNPPEPLTFDEAIAAAKAQDGKSLLEHSNTSKLLLIFLRHFGCTFCREAVADAAKSRAQFAAEGTRLAFVYMEGPERAEAFFKSYGVPDALQFSDPQQHLYRAFELRRNSLFQMISPVTMWRFFRATFSGHGASFSTTDMNQMPGSFLFHKGKIIKAYRNKTVSDRPDYCELARI